ncbi:MAG: hypothetical protein ACHQ7N_07165 [Candidatus Methylomirabilales bacterium]
MAAPTVLALRCPRCGGALRGLQQDVIFWCSACQVPHEVVGEEFVERRGSIARAALPSRPLYLPLWAFHVQYATSWEDAEREALARQVPAVEWVYVTAFELHNASYFGDPGQIFTERRVHLEAGPPASVIGCSRSLEDAKAYVEPHILTIIDRRMDVTGMELSCAIGEAMLWGVPFLDEGNVLRDGILGLKIPDAAVDELGAIRALVGTKR